MLKNNLKIIIQHFLRNKSNSIISVFGLGLGIALSIVVFIYVKHEYSYDQHFKDADKIYRIYTSSPTMQWARSLLVIGDELEKSSPLVEKATSFVYNPNGHIRNTKTGILTPEKHILAIDSNFTSVFKLKLLSGDNKAMTKPNKAFITQNIAKKYFGKKNPISKILKIQLEEEVDFTVAGIIEELPSNTHFQYNILLSQKGFIENRINFLKARKLWGTYTYIKVNNINKLLEIKEEIQQIINKNLKGVHGPPVEALTHDLQAITDIHLNSTLAHELKAANSSKHLVLILSIGIILMVISLLNFIILHSSQLLKRGKEFAIRRISGAGSSSLFKYFILEAVFLCLLSLQIAVIIIEVFHSYLFDLSNIDIPFLYYNESSVLIIIAVFFSIIIVFSSSAILFIRKINPVETLKLGIVGKGLGEHLRKILTTIQFTGIIGLLIFSFSINQQLNFLQTKDLGYKSKNVIALQNPDNEVSQIPLKQELLKITGVKGVTRCQQYPSYPMNPATFPMPGNENFPVKLTVCDKDFIKTMEIELLETWKDTLSGNTILNESLFKALNEAYEGNMDRILSHEYRPAGKMKDFHISSLHSKQEPFFLNISQIEERPFRWILISLNNNNSPKTLEDIKAVWNKFFPEDLFEYTFIEDRLVQEYKPERQSFFLINIILFVTLFIIGMGLLGTVNLMMKNRNKEIGIKKSLGASSGILLIDQMRKISTITLIAFIIACPVTFFFVSEWMKNFYYKAEASIWVYIYAGGITFAFSWLIIFWRVLKTVKANPVEYLKHE